MRLGQDAPQRAPLPPGALAAIARIVLFYALFASLWILFTDRALGLLFADPGLLQTANTLKGLLFVAVTSLLLFFLFLRFAARQNGDGSSPQKLGADGTPSQARGNLVVGIVLFSLVFVLLGSGAILQNAQRHRAQTGEHLASIARLKAAQIETWLEERRRDAQVVRTMALFRDTLSGPTHGRDTAAGAPLQARLDKFRTTMRYGGIALLDAAGEVVLQSGMEAHAITEHVRRTAQEAIAAGETRMTDIFLMEQPAPAHLHLDFISSLPGTPGGQAAPAAVLLRVDLENSLHDFLRSWPLPSDTAETVLFRRDGNAILPLSALRHDPQAAPAKRLPVAQKDMLSLQTLAPDYRPGTLIEGVDYRGMPAFGAAQPIAGTSWWLIAKIDAEEACRETNLDTLWIAFSSFLTWLVALILALLFYKQRELQHAMQQQHEQAERLRAMQLLEGIANGSTDAIFAKDTQGRYLLFNNEAARVTGKPAGEVLGRDDRVLFPPEQAELIMANDRRVMAEGVTVTFQERLDTADGPVVFLATKGPLRDAAGRCIGLFGISRDITKLKQAETALRSQAEELQARNAELERFNRAMVDRELDMIALKRQVNELSRELGRPPPYDLGAFGPAGDGGDAP